MNFLTSFKHLIFRRYRNCVIKSHTLDYLFWECTLRCNLNCLHCGSDCLKLSGTADMPLKVFVKVLDDVKQNLNPENLFVCITGGEPLLRDDLEVAGREIRKRGFKWGIVTNGLLLTDSRLKSLINAGMSAISFSLDGFENQHNKLRQNPFSFEKAFSALKSVVALSRKIPISCDVITCVSRFNLQELGNFRNFLIMNGIKRWRIFAIFPEGRAKGNADLALSRNEFAALMSFIAETRKNFRDKISLNYSCEGFLGKFELKVRDFFYFCRAGVTIASVLCDGGVTGCLSVRAADFVQGNVCKENFSDIWNKKFQVMRDRSWAKKGNCARCKDWNKCLGNSLHLYTELDSTPARCCKF